MTMHTGEQRLYHIVVVVLNDVIFVAVDYEHDDGV